MQILPLSNRRSNSYHLVENSVWPIASSFSIFSLIIGLILLFQQKRYEIWGIEINGKIITILAILSILYSSYNWWNDIIKESTYQGYHTEEVIKGLNIGYYLFILSEILIFGTLFFSFFYNSLIPSVEFSSTFPPKGIIALDYKAVPLLNTGILFFSGLSITASQNYLIGGKKNKTLLYLILTLILAFFFSYLQYFEYTHAFFTITDSVFGATFYSITGLHFFHMVIGEILLIIILMRLLLNHFLINHSLGFSFSSIYYHFVDVVWLFVYSIIYIWGTVTFA